MMKVDLSRPGDTINLMANDKLRMLLLLLALGTFGCNLWEQLNGSEKETDTPSANASLTRTQSIGETLLAEADKPFLLKPDHRFLSALSIIDRVLGHPITTGEIKATPTADGWKLNMAGTRIGELPRYPTFDDLFTLLCHYAQKQGADQLGTAVDDQMLFPKPGLLSLAFLRTLSQEWADEKSTDVAIGAAGAAISLNVGQWAAQAETDEVTSLALALLAVATNGNPKRFIQAQAIMATLTGYDTAATHKATMLPKKDPVRQLIGATMGSIRRPGAHRGGEMLQLLWMGQAIRNGQTASVLSAVQSLDGSQKSQLPILLIGGALGHTNYPVLTLITLVRATNAWNHLGERPTPDDENRPPGDQFGRLARPIDGEKALAELGLARMDIWPAIVQGLSDMTEIAPFVDRALLRGVILGAAHRAYWQLGDRTGLASWFQVGQQGPLGIVEEMTIGQLPLSSLVARDDLGAISPESLLDHLTFAKEPTYFSIDAWTAAAALFKRMDTRPSYLFKAARVLLLGIRDVRLAIETLNGAVSEGNHPRWRLTQALLTKKGTELGDINSGHLLVDDRARALVVDALLFPQKQKHALFSLRHLQKAARNNTTVAQAIDVVATLCGDFKAVANAWQTLAKQTDGQTRIDALIRASKALVAADDLPGALKVIEPLGRQKVGAAFVQAARVLIKMDKTKQAFNSARTGQGLLGSAESVVVFAKAAWADGNNEEAAVTLANPPGELTDGDWYSLVGPAFAEVFSLVPKSRAEAAFDELVTRNVPRPFLIDLIDAVAKRRFNSLAFALSVRLFKPAKEEPQQRPVLSEAIGKGRQRGYLATTATSNESLCRLYSTMVGFQKQTVADKWFRHQQVPDQAAVLKCIFGKGVPNALFTTFETPSVADDLSDESWLLRAAAAAMDHGKRSDWMTMLSSHYNDATDSLETRLGKMMLGMGDAEAALALARDQKEICKAAYFLGLKAVLDDQPEIGARWFRISITNGAATQPERQWALGALFDLADQSFPQDLFFQ